MRNIRLTYDLKVAVSNYEQKITERYKMEKIYHPVSGESGYFATTEEKILIDAILHDYSVNQLVLTSADGRGVCDE
jgi:hypothetical protein